MTEQLAEAAAEPDEAAAAAVIAYIPDTAVVGTAALSATVVLCPGMRLIEDAVGLTVHPDGPEEEIVKPLAAHPAVSLFVTVNEYPTVPPT